MERETMTTTTPMTATRNQPSLEELAQRVEQLLTSGRQRYQRLWAYYRNPMRFVGASIGEGGPSDRPYRQAQEWGLPPRITGHRAGSDVNASLPLDEVTRKEVVIENDIGWRVETMIRLRGDCGNPTPEVPQKRNPRRQRKRPKPYRLKPSKRKAPQRVNAEGAARWGEPSVVRLEL